MSYYTRITKEREEQLMACEMCGNRLMIVGTREFFTGDKRHI